jgi:hypothetical protein
MSTQRSKGQILIGINAHQDPVPNRDLRYLGCWHIYRQEELLWIHQTRHHASGEGIFPRLHLQMIYDCIDGCAQREVIDLHLVQGQLRLGYGQFLLFGPLPGCIKLRACQVEISLRLRHLPLRLMQLPIRWIQGCILCLKLLQIELRRFNLGFSLGYRSLGLRDLR